MIRKLALVATLLVPACSALDRATVERLEDISPLTADPADFALRARLPDGVFVPDGAARFTLAGARGTDRREASARLTLIERTPDGAVYALDARDLTAIRHAQATLAAWETEDPDGTSGSVGLSIALCRLPGAPEPEGRVSVDLRLAPDAGFLPLLHPVDVRRVMAAVATARTSGAADPCAPAG